MEQTYKNVELILINDGSTDHSLKIAEGYAEKYRQIKLVTQRNGGLSKARNTGMNLATGEYLCFVDSDDWLELDTLQEIVSLMDKDDLDLCLLGQTLFWLTKMTCGVIRRMIIVIVRNTKEYIRERNFSVNSIVQKNLRLRRVCIW